MKWCIFWCSLLCFISYSQEAKLPANFKRCARSDPKFDTCLNEAIEDAIKKLANGVPSLGLLPLEPMGIKQFAIGQGRGPISLDMTFKNVNIHGITDIIISDQKTDLNRTRLECKSLNKKLTLEGDYEVSGRVLLLPIFGKGKTVIVLENVDGYNVITGSTFKKHKKTYLDVKKYDFKFKTSKMTLNLENLFSGDRTLSNAMNRILNDNWDEVLQELKPSFEEVFSEIFREVANRLYQKVSLEDLYPGTL